MLSALSFVDLQLGPDYMDMTGIPGRNAAREEIPVSFRAAAAELKAACERRYLELAEPEFSVSFDNLMMRVTVLPSLRDGEPVYFIRRMGATIRDFMGLGLPEEVEEFLLGANLSGIVLFVGEQRMGKTSSAASFVQARLKAHGGLTVTVEHPPETLLDGLHGEGRCIQVPVTAKHGGFGRQLEGAMRTGASTLYIGEILNGMVAEQAVIHGINGMLVVSTMHASGPAEAVSRLVSFVPEKAQQIAAGLAAIVHQQIVTHGTHAALVFETLCVTGEARESIQTKIRDGNHMALKQDVDMQKRRNAQ